MSLGVFHEGVFGATTNDIGNLQTGKVKCKLRDTHGIRETVTDSLNNTVQLRVVDSGVVRVVGPRVVSEGGPGVVSVVGPVVVSVGGPWVVNMVGPGVVRVGGSGVVTRLFGWFRIVRMVGPGLMREFGPVVVKMVGPGVMKLVGPGVVRVVGIGLCKSGWSRGSQRG